MSRLFHAFLDNLSNERSFGHLIDFDENPVSRFATFLQNNSVIIQAHGLQFDQGLILESEWSFSPVDIISPIWNTSGWNPCRFHSQSEISTFSQRKKLAVTLLKFSKSRHLILAVESSRTPQTCDSNSFIILRFYLSFVAKLVYEGFLLSCSSFSVLIL